MRTAVFSKLLLKDRTDYSKYCFAYDSVFKKRRTLLKITLNNIRRIVVQYGTIQRVEHIMVGYNLFSKELVRATGVFPLFQNITYEMSLS